MFSKLMNLDILVKIVKYINKIPSCAKTCIIIVLCGIILNGYVSHRSQDILKQYSIFTQQNEQDAENYTFETASNINRAISSISRKDSDCFNVLLLSYHNTQKSIQGYRYLYLNCLTEKPKEIEYEPVHDYWSNLEYIYYEDELNKIHDHNYLVIKDIEDIKTTMPKIYRKLKISEAKAAIFYTIEGKQNPVGLIVILYDEVISSNKKNIITDIVPEIQKLVLLLDYVNSKE